MLVWPAGLDITREVSLNERGYAIAYYLLLICAERRILRRVLRTKSRDIHLGDADRIKEGAGTSET